MARKWVPPQVKTPLLDKMVFRPSNIWCPRTREPILKRINLQGPITGSKFQTPEKLSAAVSCLQPMQQGPNNSNPGINIWTWLMALVVSVSLKHLPGETRGLQEGIMPETRSVGRSLSSWIRDWIIRVVPGWTLKWKMLVSKKASASLW